MQKKFNTVLHFNIRPSTTVRYVEIILYFFASSLLLLSSLEWFFKGLLLALLMLEYVRQYTIKKNSNSLNIIEIRDGNLFLKGSGDTKFLAIEHVKLKQNRIFAQLELHLKNEVRHAFLYRDSFSSKKHFSLLMQQLRFQHA